ncbi:hypothetical protein HU200_057674 [Digitaria exilis]|uniref:Uncharacterized protein n=1 Tax=Digitaria exilis TaxID=1010633 RepID=A0A835AAY5_9POAL|nr:hypothetical protein HU200_057674 [Digitaria exilis]CAB3448448.1 unnamed protein product [Digitaria exilis]
MAGACAVAAVVPSAAPFQAFEPNSTLPPRRGSFFRVSCRHSYPRNRGRTRSSRRDPAESDAGVGGILKDDSSYLLTLLLGSVGGAVAIKYGSILLPDITRPNIVQALLMVSLPVVAAVLLLLRASSKED